MPRDPAEAYRRRPAEARNALPAANGGRPWGVDRPIPPQGATLSWADPFAPPRLSPPLAGMDRSIP